MTFDASSDWLSSVIGAAGRPPAREFTHQDYRIAAAECLRNGHKYRVHGRTAPTKISCSNCRDEWGIGPRTLPPQAASS